MGTSISIPVRFCPGQRHLFPFHQSSRPGCRIVNNISWVGSIKGARTRKHRRERIGALAKWVKQQLHFPTHDKGVGGGGGSGAQRLFSTAVVMYPRASYFSLPYIPFASCLGEYAPRHDDEEWNLESSRQSLTQYRATT